MRYFVGSQSSEETTLVPIEEEDMLDFLAWLRRDIQYKVKRSKQHRARRPGAGDANAESIRARRELVRKLQSLLGIQEVERQPTNNNSVTQYGHVIARRR